MKKHFCELLQKKKKTFKFLFLSIILAFQILLKFKKYPTTFDSVWYYGGYGFIVCV